MRKPSLVTLLSTQQPPTAPLQMMFYKHNPADILSASQTFTVLIRQIMIAYNPSKYSLSNKLIKQCRVIFSNKGLRIFYA